MGAMTNETERYAHWHDFLNAHGAEHGGHLRIGKDHGALLTLDGETLIVTFEMGKTIRDNAQSAGALPYGLQIAGRTGCSQLCLYSETNGFFRDPQVIGYFDSLVDEGFFDGFDRVLFYGVGPCGYAAATYSVAAPAAIVVALQPLATLDPDRTEWERRFPEMRRTDFTRRYGYAPAMVEPAEQVFILYNPAITPDVMHASLFNTPNITHLRCPGIGRELDRELADMGVLDKILLRAARGKFSAAAFHSLYRARRNHLPWLRRLVSKAKATGRPELTRIAARAALARYETPRFRAFLEDAEAELMAQEHNLPAPQNTKEAAE